MSQTPDLSKPVGCLLVIAGFLACIPASIAKSYSPASEGPVFLICFLVAIVAMACIVAYSVQQRNKKLSEMSPDDRIRSLEVEHARQSTQQWGPINSVMVCPHCQTAGFVRAKPIVQKQGISGTKATGALLTGGVSMLATGLSRKENRTQAHCDNCGSTWIF
jgi:hypothetical protein